MDRKRLHEIADLVMDATDLFRGQRIPHSISLEIGQYPEVCIFTDLGTAWSKTFRYISSSPLLSDKLDPNFDAAEEKIRELVKGAVTNDAV